MRLCKKIGRLMDWLIDKHFWAAFMLYYFVAPGIVALLLIWITDLGFHNELPSFLQLIFDWCLENILIPIIIIICIPFVIVQASKNNP
nr:MAG TPA: hypothetical protein [Bacteriophage sp.]